MTDTPRGSSSQVGALWCTPRWGFTTPVAWRVGLPSNLEQSFEIYGGAAAMTRKESH